MSYPELWEFWDAHPDTKWLRARQIPEESGCPGLGPAGDDSIAQGMRHPSPGLSIPRAVFGVAMLTLLRLPFLPVSGLVDGLRCAPAHMPFFPS